VDFVVCALAVKKKIRAGFDMSDQTIPLSAVPITEPQPHPQFPSDEAAFDGKTSPLRDGRAVVTVLTELSQ
jgi:hypothetical protein